MARPTDESGTYGADEARPDAELLNSTHQDTLEEASDGDGSERPVREKLKKTSIASLSQYTKAKTNPVLQPDELPTTTENQGERADLSSDATNTTRGRPARKRSFDDLQQEDTQNDIVASQPGGIADKGSHHKRMRSRDISGGEDTASNGQPRTKSLERHDEEESDMDARRSPGGPGVLVEPPTATETTPPSTDLKADNTILSPKKKRSRDQFDKDQDPNDEGSDDSTDSIIRPGSEPAETDDQLAQMTSRTATGEPEKKRPRDDELKSEVKPNSGFANTATASPFAAFSRSKSPLAGDQSSGKRFEQPTETPSTSTSAFATSGLSAFSSSEKSPFAALNSNSASASGGFGSLGSPDRNVGGFGSAGGFGGASPFATKASSGFGGLGSSGFGGLGGSSIGGNLGGGFGRPRTLGDTLSSFAAPSRSAATFGGGSSAKAFGAPAQEDYGDSEEDNDDDTDEEAAMDKPKDKRFQDHDLETGEEGEETIFSCRAKLYHFEDKVWKERGVGTFKINTTWAPSSEESGEHKSRLIMRTDGVHKVALNTPVFKGMKVGAPEGGEPNGKTLHVTGMEGGKPTLFALKIGKEDVVKDLYHKIMDLEAGL